MTGTLAERWRAARPKPAGIHLDSGACSRQGFAAIDAAAQHARHEAEVGGYVAVEAATPVLDAGRAAVAALTGLAATDVVFTTGSNHALDLLLRSWDGDRSVACLVGEYGPNLAIMAANGFQVSPLPVDTTGRLHVDAAAEELARDRPALVHLTPLGSHRGLAQPLGPFAEVCRDLGLPLVVDAAQALGHLDCAVAPDAIYASSRKWLAGPRGVGVLAVRPEFAERLRPGFPPSEPAAPLTVLQQLEHGESNAAARVGFSVAIGEHLAAGVQQVRTRLAEVGRLTRAAMADVPGWRVVEPVDEPTAITTLEPTDGADPHRVRAWLIAERRIVTTACDARRAPRELTVPVLRLSPHVDVTADELGQAAAALAEAARL
ncbi:ergothioneine biosynthesis PLP-dependent enzyme EgtE [Mycolicibacterium monacense]|uniref:Probable hercynylcysteine sulfoxide lyase n=1 Tax=Mycolicibacterium monacense TaxID=85693 RepID=A0AAD1J296_MYCMB|nr:ergothioneine biosynthesis PLP-dependent enzyme EgtE [Mycolicibacterium monacense]MDA4105387.1 pyridoxal-5'-phosphate-dependent protein [Mycolicibacterium monacense DSM 44395]ORB15743.1 ergothioneine biosynthesis PLP-dependent enzyme EgtE [Mycolicibacterium monacense DSM 44395]QHP88592.1 ergothioneine biosynthesis PLP-dependent enzyme EgtE [Mycolicibacterium monacense DSM 44395]BBZ63980.1 putative hercynylcysteine sulfoxide lyase [Mycolicibacterium monacense]